MGSDRQIRLAGGGLALGFGLAIVLAVIGVATQTTALLFSDTFVGNAPGAGYLDEFLQIVGDQAELIRSLALTRAVSGLLILYGILTLVIALRDDTTGGYLRGLGALAGVVAIITLIVGLGLDLVSAHVLAIGEASGDEAELELALSNSETLTLASWGMAMMAGLTATIASAALHLGLASRSIFRHSSTISLIVGIIAILTLVLIVFANYASSVVVQTYGIANILGTVPRIWLLVIGIMMYRKGDEILDG